MGYFDECRVCKPPRRHPGCHDRCPDYAKGKAKQDADKAAAGKSKKIDDSIRRQKYSRIKQALKRSGRKWGE